MVLLYFMDGLKFDMVDQFMPFLASQHKIPLKSDFGYSCACHATMYTSRYVDEHNTWFIWKKGEHSPYRFVDKIPGLKYLNWLPVKVLVSKLARKLHPSRSFSGIPMLVNLPLKYWSSFEPCERQFWSDDDYLPGFDTLFKILKKEKIPHRIVGLSKGGDVFAEEAAVDYSACEFVYYFIGDVDDYMHKHGESSQASVGYLKQVDDFLKTTFEKARACQEDVTAVFYSDHGHIDVEKKIDIQQYFKPLGLSINRYLHLVESTFVRFWFRSEEERRQVTAALNAMEAQEIGFIMGPKEFDEYHLHFDSNEHGDLIFHLRAPNIFTNTIWGYGKTIRSMHGYEPTLPKHYGVFASNRPVRQQDFAYLTDVLPTVTDALHICRDGYTFRGENLLE